jgi:5'-3' exonuclease
MLSFIDGDPILYQAAWGRRLGDAKAQVLRRIQESIEDTFADDYIIALGTSSNFRVDLYPDYKRSNSRVTAKSKLPDWFGELKEYLGEQPNIVKAVGMESDDLLRMWSFQAVEAGDPFVLCSIDKDLDCIPGLHYNSKYRKSYEVTPDEANAFYWQQILQGDSTDNIPGLPRVGPVKAKAMLAGLKTEEERQQRVIKEYQSVYGDNWKNYLLSNGKMIHMWRFENDHFKI